MSLTHMFEWIPKTLISARLSRGSPSLLSYFGVTCVFLSWLACVFLFCVIGVFSTVLFGPPWAFGLGLLLLGLRPGFTSFRVSRSVYSV